MSQKINTDDDLGWGSPIAAATVHRTSFPEPEMVTDITDRADDKNEHDGDDENAALDHDHDEETDDSKAAAAGGLNYPVLAIFGLLVLCAVGGIGWWANKQFVTPKINPAREVGITESALAKLSATPVVSPAMATLAEAKVEMVSIFEEPAKAVTSIALVTPVPSAPSSGPSNVATPVSFLAASAAALPSRPSTYAAAVPTVKAASDVAQAAPLIAPAEPVVTSAPPATPASSPSVATAAVKTVNPAAVAADQPKQPVKAKTPSTLVRRAVAAKKAHATVVVAQRKTNGTKTRKVVTAKASSSNEEFLLPRGLSVRSIYPTSGPNAQAWLSDSNGKVEIVRVGESLRSGPQVISIRGEKGEVLTSAGLVTSRGATR